MSWVTTTEVVCSRTLHVDDELRDLLRAEGVETGGRLVVEDDFRIQRDRAGEGHALAHAARELGRHLALDARQADHGELLGDDRGDLFRASCPCAA